MGKLEQITNILDNVWEDLIYDPCSLLPTLLDIDLIDDKWLAYLKPQLGFTADIPFAATTEELRRILSLAIPYWNEKPTELGVIKNAIRMVTGNRFRLANWFDFRMQVDKTCITEELEDFDPYVLGFLSNKFDGDSGQLGEAGIYFFNASDLPITFANQHDYRWFSVDDDPAYPANEGIYEIDYVVPDTQTGYVKMPFDTAHAGAVKYRIWGHMEDYISEVRLVDQGVGDVYYRDEVNPFSVSSRVWGVDSGAYGIITAVESDYISLRSIFGRFGPNEELNDDSGGEATAVRMVGVLNRELLDFLMSGRTVRPFSERIDVVYINFLDQFRIVGDLDQWLVNDPDKVSITKPAGPCRLVQGGRIQSADPYQAWWDDQVTAWKIIPVDPTTVAHLTFMGTDASNSYYVLMDYNSKVVELWKIVAGTPTQIGSTVSLPYLKQGIQDVVRIDALAEGTGVRIRVKVNGETEIDQLDDPYAFNSGRVGAYALTDDLDLELVEVNVLPTEIQRIGLDP